MRVVMQLLSVTQTSLNIPSRNGHPGELIAKAAY